MGKAECLLEIFNKEWLERFRSQRNDHIDLFPTARRAVIPRRVNPEGLKTVTHP